MTKILFGTIAHVIKEAPQKHALEIIEGGGLVLGEDGRILGLGKKEQMKKQFSEAEIMDFGEAWILPGFVDGHIHFPQLYATAAFGNGLLDWLDKSVFPCEMKYRDEGFAAGAAHQFVKRLLESGTTTAMVFGSQFHHATSSLFREAREQGLRMIAGLTLMDRNGPSELFTPARTAYHEASSLIQEIEDSPLLHYAITPRFAISCSDELMEVCARLFEEFPSCYIQTHINENLGEIQEVQRLYPDAEHYTGVYDSFGMLTPRTVLAHNIHAGDAELTMIRKRGSAICHCPASNAYLGSGLFPLKKHLDLGIPVMMGTDVGAGTNFSILSELGEAFKCQQLQGFRLDAAMLLYLGTLAGARALRLDDRIGNFEVGKDGDLVVLDPQQEPYLSNRLKFQESPEARLFSILNLAGPQHLVNTMVAGRFVAKGAWRQAEL